MSDEDLVFSVVVSSLYVKVEEEVDCLRDGINFEEV